MSGKPKLHYFNGRGRMESIRWLLAAAGVEFEECFLETKDDLTKLQKDGSLLFQQVPMVEIDGMKMVQTRAILGYIAAKYNLYGKDLKERALIDMYVEGLLDLNEILMTHVAQPADKKEQHLATIVDKATNRYFPAFEKVLKDHGQEFLVGNRLSRADVQLLETLLMAEEYKADILAKFPLLQSFKARISNIPTIKKFLQPGSQRKPPLQEKDLPKVMKQSMYGPELWQRRLPPAWPRHPGARSCSEPSEAAATAAAAARRPGEPAHRPPRSAARRRSCGHSDSSHPLAQGLRPRPLPGHATAVAPRPPRGPRSPAVPAPGAAAATRRPRRQPGGRGGLRNPHGGGRAGFFLSYARRAQARSLTREDGPRYRRAWRRSVPSCRGGGSIGGAEGNKNSEIMAGKPKLHYAKGRGKMESIRWLLAAAGVEFEEEFIETKEDLEKLRNDGVLMFQQVPMVEIDGMKMVQTRAILSYIAAKYNLYGKDLKERAWIDMYVEGTTDLMGMIMYHPFQPADTKEKNLALIIERATTRYFPVYEKALKDHGHDYLVGNKLSWADIHLLEAILMAEECKPDILSAFPLLQAFKGRTSNIPTIKKFLQPGSQRKPQTDEKFVATVRKIFNF
ncbi:uncharacterized protein AAHN32_004746 [Aegotheles albertisi]